MELGVAGERPSPPPFRSATFPSARGVSPRTRPGASACAQRPCPPPGGRRVRHEARQGRTGLGAAADKPRAATLPALGLRGTRHGAQIPRLLMRAAGAGAAGGRGAVSRALRPPGLSPEPRGCSQPSSLCLGPGDPSLGLGVLHRHRQASFTGKADGSWSRAAPLLQSRDRIT